eukprot:TRINITY_DN12537_c0_g1_i5.p1 TRINITY_DN12537_c0_g1~~TRINITY_DN12537_c0_g1_i5.p1  ORF type:complete len:305 (+),score=104.86 TRINITY_DN12537_c0_g1_i5:25-915(+)
MIRRPPRSTHCISSAASDVYKRQIMNCQYVLSEPYPFAGEMPSSDVEVAVCAIALKKDGLTLNSLFQCMAKHKPKLKPRIILMTDINETKVASKEVKVERRPVVGANKKGNSEKQGKISSLYAVSKKGAKSPHQEIKEGPRDEEQSVESKKEPISQGNETKESADIKENPDESKKKVKRLKRDRDPSPESNPSSKPIPKLNQHTNNLQEKREQLVDLKQEDKSEYKEVIKTRKEKKTVTRMDEHGYLTVEDFYEDVEYVDKIKVKPQVAAGGAEDKPKKKKKDSRQMDIGSFFKPK